MKKAMLRMGLACCAMLAAAGNVHGQFISEARMMGLDRKLYDAIVRPVKGKKELQATFLESCHRGSYREIGRSEASALLRAYPDFVRTQYHLLKLLGKPRRDVSLIKKDLATLFPAILEEFQGFAEVMGLDCDEVIRSFSFSMESALGCSLVAVGREKTAGGAMLVGRNYDFIPTMHDNHFIETSPSGAHASLGSAAYVFGRVEGINDRGLFIGMADSQSYGRNKKGFLFPLIVRAVLDKASSIEEAVTIIGAFPQSSGVNYLVADRSGRAVVVEIDPGRKTSLRRMGGSTGDDFLIATNHFQGKGMRIHNKRIMPNSLERARILRRLLSGKENVTAADIMALLTGKRPDGVYLNDYDMLLGTLHSAVYDLDRGVVLMQAGDLRREYRLGEQRENTIQQVSYDNTKSNPLDYISTDGFNPTEPGSPFYTLGILFVSSPVLSPVIDFSAGYRWGLKTEKTYGPHIEASFCALITPAYVRAGVRLEYNPVPLLSLQVTPSYLGGWRIYGLAASSEKNTKTITDNFTKGRNEDHHTAALAVNPVFRFGSFVRLENRFDFFFFKERVYEYECALLVKNMPVWSPSLQVLIPYNQKFLWGLRSAWNWELSSKEYNGNIGPLFAFPKLLGPFTLALQVAYWIHLAESEDIIQVLAALQARF